MYKSDTHIDPSPASYKSFTMANLHRPINNHMHPKRLVYLLLIHLQNRNYRVCPDPVQRHKYMWLHWSRTEKSNIVMFLNMCTLYTSISDAKYIYI